MNRFHLTTPNFKNSLKNLETNSFCTDKRLFNSNTKELYFLVNTRIYILTEVKQK